MSLSKFRNELTQLTTRLADAVPEEQVEGMTHTLLLNLARPGGWSDEQSTKFGFYCRKFDIANRLLSLYGADGRGVLDSGEISTSVYELFVSLIISDLVYLYQQGKTESALKRLNTLYKSLERIRPSWFSSGALLSEKIGAIEVELLSAQPLGSIVSVEDESDAANRGEALPTALRTVPLTVLFYDGPIARAYLETLKSIGIQPQKILHLVPANDVQTNNRVGRWLPRMIRSSYAATVHRSKIHYWPNAIAKKHRQFCEKIYSEISGRLGFEEATQQAARALYPLENYSEDVEQILVDGLGDPALVKFLEQNVDGVVLFTGGGLVPRQLLEVPSIRLIHIHPGYLPQIRGADCALWSHLLSGHMSASCFFMAPGIDTGDVIRAMWMPNLDFPDSQGSIDYSTLYRCVYGFIDPWIRSYVLRSVLSEFAEIDRLHGHKQSESIDSAYNFMHKKMGESSIQRLFSA